MNTATATQLKPANNHHWPTAPVTPEERDHMPREVATSMLTAPKAKLSNRVRKECLKAREIVFTSERPIVVTEEGLKRLMSDLGVEEQQERKVSRKMAEKNILQLKKIAIRSASRREQIQSQFERLNAQLPPEGVTGGRLQVWAARKDAGLNLLSAAAARCDLLRDSAEGEIAKRFTPRIFRA